MFKGAHGMLFRRKRETRTYDRETQKRVIRDSICTGFLHQLCKFRCIY